MNKTSLKIKILSGIVCTGLTLSGTNLSFAAVKQNDSVPQRPATSMDFRFPMDKIKVEESRHTEMKVILEAVIKDCVKSNVITQTEGDKVLEYVTLKANKRCGDHKKCKKEKADVAKGGLFKGLVTDGILTEEKADALREKMYVKKAEIRTEELQKNLNALVGNKVLSIEQSNKVQEVIVAREAERRENYKKMKGMNETERKDYMKKNMSNRVNPLKVLIDNGTITKEQEKEIQKILPEYGHGHHGFK